MSDISVTAANVAKGTGARVRTGIAGATITAGQYLYIDTAASNVLKKAIGTSSAAAKLAGVALNGASSGQPVTYQYEGPYTVGGTVAVGESYAVSAANAGGVCPEADLTTGNYVKPAGIGISTTQIYLFNTQVDPVLHA